MGMTYRTAARLAGAVTAILVLAGCEAREPEWHSYDEINISQQPARPSMPRPETRASSATRTPLKWTRPEGWQEKPGSGMRMATLSVSNDSGQAVCTLVTLGGTAGGLEANMRRWIGQLDLNPPPEQVAGLLETAIPITTEGGFEGVVVDLTGFGPAGDGTSMLAAMITVNGTTLFVKMTGPIALLSAEKDRFVVFCRSLRADT